MTPRTGRPHAENPVNNRFSVCLDDETLSKLNAYCDEEKVTKSVAVRRGLSLLFSRKKKRKEE